MKRILFVDDEARILEGLQRMLRPNRKEWDMRFARSGDEALALLEAEPADIVVTDMRMPGMDGAELLKRVQALCPGAIRIVLSGHFDGDAALRAVPVAHQYLAKPCDPDTLRAVIERCSGSSDILADEAARRLVGAMGQLPVFQTTRASLLHALDDPSCSLDSIGDLVGHDVGISAKVLQLVHSAFFGLPRDVVDVNTAVSYLGLDTIRQLLMLAEVMRSFRPGMVQGFTLQEFERHSRLTARIVARLPLPKRLVSTAVVASLLHDVGILVQAARLPDELGAAWAAAEQRGVPLHVAEAERCGTTHAEVGAYLLSLWGFPAEVVGAVRRHHRPELPATPTGELDLGGAVHVADVLANAHFEGYPLLRDGQTAPEQWEYPMRAGLADQLPAWRELAALEAQVCEAP